MHSLLLFDVDDRKIPVDELKRVFQTVPGFRQLRTDSSDGVSVEANYVDGEDFTTVELDSECETISIRGTSGAALKAAWILQAHLDYPLQMVDTDYSFDVIVRDFSSLEELSAAVENA
jgi:hypothetical protein